MTFATNDTDPWSQIATWVFQIAGDIRYGKVEITTQDACVVQLDVTEKFRLPSAGRPPAEPRPRRRQNAKAAGQARD